MTLPSKNLSALCCGRKNWKESELKQTEVRLDTLEGLCKEESSGNVSSPSLIRAKKPTRSWATNKKSS